MDGYVGAVVGVGCPVSYKVVKRIAPAIAATSTLATNVSATAGQSYIDTQGYGMYRASIGVGGFGMGETWKVNARM